MLIIPLIIPIGMFIFSVKEMLRGDKSMRGYVLAVIVAILITTLLSV